MVWHCRQSTCYINSNVSNSSKFVNKLWSNEEVVYDYKAAAPAGRKIYAPAVTQYLTIIYRQKLAVMQIPK